MKNLFVSCEIAKLLKEKGFNEPCLCIYERREIYSVQLPTYASGLLFKNVINKEVGNKTICAPLYQQVVDFLRQKHDMVVSIKKDWCNGKVLGFEGVIDDKNGYIDTGTHKSYYHALDKAIKVAIKLI